MPVRCALFQSECVFKKFHGCKNQKDIRMPGYNHIGLFVFAAGTLPSVGGRCSIYPTSSSLAAIASLLVPVRGALFRLECVFKKFHGCKNQKDIRMPGYNHIGLFVFAAGTLPSVGGRCSIYPTSSSLAAIASLRSSDFTGGILGEAFVDQRCHTVQGLTLRLFESNTWSSFR